MKASLGITFISASALLACSAERTAPTSTKRTPSPTPSAVVSAASTSSQRAPVASQPVPSPSFKLAPKTIGMRSGITPPLIVRPDGSSNLAGAKDVVRVSDHYSACFVTRSGRVNCWGIMEGGHWNGVAAQDPNPGLNNIIDIAIHQTEACALTQQGSVWCWSKNAAPTRHVLPGPAREIMRSIQGRGCALLADTTVASWSGEQVERLRSQGRDVRGITQLLSCDPGLACGLDQSAQVTCVATPERAMEHVRPGQVRLLEALPKLPPGWSATMNDQATVICKYRRADVCCFDGEHHEQKPECRKLPRPIQEMALGYVTLNDKSVRSAACARDDQGVLCWDIRKTDEPIRIK